MLKFSNVNDDSTSAHFPGIEIELSNGAAIHIELYDDDVTEEGVMIHITGPCGFSKKLYVGEGEMMMDG